MWLGLISSLLCLLFFCSNFFFLFPPRPVTFPFPFTLFCLLSPLVFTSLYLVLQPAEEDWEGDLEGEWDLSDRYRHSLNGEIARLQVRVHTYTLRNTHTCLHSFGGLMMFLLQGLYEAGWSGWKKDWMYRQFTGERQFLRFLGLHCLKLHKLVVSLVTDFRRLFGCLQNQIFNRIIDFMRPWPVKSALTFWVLIKQFRLIEMKKWLWGKKNVKTNHWAQEHNKSQEVFMLFASAFCSHLKEQFDTLGNKLICFPAES